MMHTFYIYLVNPSFMVLSWVDMLKPIVLCLVLVYLIDNSSMMLMVEVIHPVRCGLAIVLRCCGLSKVRCSGDG
jgi:hypothetical protein